MRISDWSSDVCSSDLHLGLGAAHRAATGGSTFAGDIHLTYRRELREGDPLRVTSKLLGFDEKRLRFFQHMYHAEEGFLAATRSEEHTSELKSLMRISNAVFSLKNIIFTIITHIFISKTKYF